MGEGIGSSMYGPLLFLVGLTAGAVAAWLYYRSITSVLGERIGGRDRQIQELEARAQKAENQADSLAKESAALNATLASERRAYQEKRQFVEEARVTFGALSAEALKSNNTAFLDLAKQTLEKHQSEAKGDLEGRQTAIEQLVKPLRESLGNVDRQIQELEKSRTGAYAGLSEQVKAMAEVQDGLRAETRKLVNALRTPQGRGRWGEIQLKRVVELAGMVERCDFHQQRHADTEEGRLRPDLVVHLPLGKRIVVDSKVPLKGYLEALEATDDITRALKMKEHAAQVRTHMEQLSGKNYWAHFRPTPEYVVMFLPAESLLYAALEQDPGLLENGPERGVIIATPTTLIALLKAVAYGWHQEALADNARKIGELGKELYVRLSTVNEFFAKLGRNLDKTVGSYNEAMGSLESRVMVTARRFKDLGLPSTEEIPVLRPVDRTARALRDPDSPETLFRAG